MEPVERWQIAVAVGLAVLGGLSWIFFGFGISNGNGFLIVLSLVPALWCLAAGWVLRSWQWMAVVALVYVVVSAPLWHALSINDSEAGRDFVLYVVLPGIVMSAIGTAIGRYRARQAALHPSHRHPSL